MSLTPRLTRSALLSNALCSQIPVGDQPSDIERQIYGLVSSYISKPNCIIIAVSPANVDLANSDSLKLARTIDPQGRRTIGVLTKLDLMDQGTHALDVLTGRVYPLKLGFIGVVNRSQKDINGNVSMLAARRAEEEFFRAHPAYRNISHRSGTKYLTKILNSVLMNHIRDKLPDMKARLNTLMGQTQQELAAFGDTTFLGDQHRGTLILKLMTQFARDFVASIDGTTFDISTKELCGGARVYHIFHDVFGHALDSINPTQNLTVQDIRTAIRNSTGPRPSLFVPEAAFELLIKPQIKLLEPPSLRCVELVYEELMKICHNCTSKELERFPRLHSQLIEVVSELLRERLGPTSEYVQSLIHIQAAYINTNHPAFVQDSANIARQTRQDNQSTQRNLITQRRGSFGSDSQSAGAAAIVTDEDDDQADSSTRKVNGTALSKMGRSKGGPRSHHSGNNNSSSSSSASNTLHSGRGVQQATSSSSCGPASPAIVGSAPRESFLDYFFGGASAVPGSSVSGAVPGLGPTAPAHRNNLLPELSSSSQSHQSHQLYHSQRSNLMAGRTGLEGSSAAYDMKSLDKHLEAGPFTGDHLSLSEREVLETNLIRSLISSYFSIVRQCIQDLVPKAVMHLLVNFSRESVQNRLVSALYKESLFGNLLEEDEALTNERKRLMELLGTYKEAMMLLSGI